MKPFDKSAFSRIANDGIYAKWSDKVLSGLITSLFRLMVSGLEFFPELCSVSVGFIKGESILSKQRQRTSVKEQEG